MKHTPIRDEADYRSRLAAMLLVKGSYEIDYPAVAEALRRVLEDEWAERLAQGQEGR
ncbi:MAG: hypothetical protein ACJ8HI_08340 [Massilia sp.]|jgi:hypothetical protein